jgi:protein O-mannosyl-transferase
LGKNRIRKGQSPIAVSRPAAHSATHSILLAAGEWVVLFCVALIAYSPALRGEMLWDDDGHITSPSLRSLHGLWRIWFEPGATQQYYPLLHSAFWIEHRIWGSYMPGYHLVNITLHTISAYLVVSIVRRLSLPGARLAGLVFALHPVCVEAVAWISEQKSTLSAAFFLAAVLTYLHFDRTRSRRQYFFAFGLFLLALLSKTVTATLPATLLVLLWWLRGRIDWRRDVWPLLPWFVLAAPAGLFTAWVEKTYIGAHGKEFALSISQRLLLAGRIPWFYAFKAVWPVNLMFSYPRWNPDPAEWWQYLFPAGLIALAAILAWFARRNRGPMAGFLIFVITLFPVLGFLNVFPFRYSYVADHFQYLAILGIIVPITSGLSIWCRRMAGNGLQASIATALLPVTLGFLSWQQSANYRDSETLYRATLARNPESYFVHLDLGTLLFMNPARLDEAISHFESAVRVKPDSADAHMNLGTALAEMPDRVPAAIEQYRAALRLQPNFADAHNNLGLALASQPGHLGEAIAEYRTALRIEPRFAEAHLNLGLACSRLPGELPEAVTEYQAALAINAELPDARRALAEAYARIPGHEADAVAQYQTALRTQPDSATMHFGLGNVLQKIRRLPEAVAEYREALRRDPRAPEVRYELAYALAQTPGGLPEAITECQTMLDISPGNEAGRKLMASLIAIRDGHSR